MSETYQSKRERWQRLSESLPAGLREHVALRNVEAVAALPPQAQARLLEAIRSGLKRLPPAVEKLKANLISQLQSCSNRHRRQLFLTPVMVCGNSLSKNFFSPLD